MWTEPQPGAMCGTKVTRAGNVCRTKHSSSSCWQHGWRCSNFQETPLLCYNHSSSLSKWMCVAYNSQGTFGDDAYGDLIPILVTDSFWWKRRELLESRLEMSPPALLPVLGLVHLSFLSAVLKTNTVTI
ncbi:MAG: hypothetical protein KGJ60_11265 [Verrucomicrobiota bacterium]|nr:hypothetical protein [Verrucomicrobiota bacterium]